MQIQLSSVVVSDQERALRFYTGVLGFVKKQDFAAGGARWLTLVSPDEPDGTEVVLEPSAFPAAKTYQKQLFDAGIPLTSFAVGDLGREFDRLRELGATFKVPPIAAGTTTIAVLDGTCGNLIQLFEAPSGEKTAPFRIKVRLTSVMVEEQERALAFYTKVVGFERKRDFPVGDGRWLTVVSPAAREGTELLLEPMGVPPAHVYQAALREGGIPLIAFGTHDVQREYERMRKLGVTFTMAPTNAGPTTLAVFDDTSGNLIQIFQR